MVQVDWASVPGSAWAAVVWAGVVASAGAHSAIAWAIGRCSAVLPSTYSTMQPLLTGALAAAVLGQVSRRHAPYHRRTQRQLRNLGLES